MCRGRGWSTLRVCPECGVQGEHEYCAYCGKELMAEASPQEVPYQSPYVTAREAELQRKSLASPPHLLEPVHDGEPEPEVGEWKLIVGILLLLPAFFFIYSSLIGLSFIAWYLKDLHEWRAWAERVHSDRH